MLNPNKYEVIAQALEHLMRGKSESASACITTYYPFIPRKNHKRSWTQYRALSIFYRDGFIDRYTGDRLVYPGALRVLSLMIPDDFPAHPNWKMSETHMAYWELFPTLDHIQPIGRGGEDTNENIVTTSMLRNQAKSNWTLDELGWKLHYVGNTNDWDGLLLTTTNMVEASQELLNDNYLHQWHIAAKRIISENK